MTAVVTGGVLAEVRLHRLPPRHPVGPGAA
jgi:hypothetical protein